MGNQLQGWFIENVWPFCPQSCQWSEWMMSCGQKQACHTSQANDNKLSAQDKVVVVLFCCMKKFPSFFAMSLCHEHTMALDQPAVHMRAASVVHRVWNYFCGKPMLSYTGGQEHCLVWGQLRINLHPSEETSLFFNASLDEWKKMGSFYSQLSFQYWVLKFIPCLCRNPVSCSPF